MRLPTPLSRRDPEAHKNQFGHVLILAGSRSMLGASALCGLSAMRSGAGLVTLAVPQSLNSILQKKISPVLMTLPLKETKVQTFSVSAYSQLKNELSKYDAVAIGPGLTVHPQTVKFVNKIIENTRRPLVIDADALNALSLDLSALEKNHSVKVLTPHPGEMARLLRISKKTVETERKKSASGFAKKYGCVLVLKGSRTIVAAPDGKVYANTTGNAGMATAGSGDVLTGMIAAFLGQGIEAFEASKFGAYLHGKAGDIAARTHTKASLIATDIIEAISPALKTTPS